MGNIVGLDLKINENYLADAVKQTVIMGISESLNGKNEIVSQIVKSVLSIKVDDKGTVSSYNSYNKFTLLEWYTSNILRDLAKEEIKNIVDERRTELRKMIRTELSKKGNLDKFVNTFIKNTTESLDSAWKTTINIDFEARNGD